MGRLFGKPKQKDYEAGPSATAEAKIGLAKHARWEELYGPLGKKQMEKAAKYDVGAVADRVASADIAQIFDRPGYEAVKNVTSAANRASGAIPQYLMADQQALGTKREMQLGALNIGTNKQAVDALGLSNVTRLETVGQLEKAAAKEKIGAALGGGLGQMASAAYYGWHSGEEFDVKRLGKGGDVKWDIYRDLKGLGKIG